MSALAEAPVPKVGDPVAAIDTPALVIDLDAMERNCAAMADFARARRVRLRPHAKMHKCAAIARLQRTAGAVGVCVQKTSEAEALAWLEQQGVKPADAGSVDAGVSSAYVQRTVPSGANA